MLLTKPKRSVATPWLLVALLLLLLVASAIGLAQTSLLDAFLVLSMEAVGRFAACF